MTYNSTRRRRKKNKAIIARPIEVWITDRDSLKISEALYQHCFNAHWEFRTPCCALVEAYVENFTRPKVTFEYPKTVIEPPPNFFKHVNVHKTTWRLWANQEYKNELDDLLF